MTKIWICLFFRQKKQIKFQGPKRVGIQDIRNLVDCPTVTKKGITLIIYNAVSPKVFVCVEVLRPSQPNGIMSSAVSLPNHTFTGQA